MKEREHPIDKLFASRLKGLEPTPAANAWSRLEKGLQQKKASKKGVIWWYCAAAVAVLILFGALLINADKQLDGIHATDIASSLSGSQPASGESKPSVENNPVATTQPPPAIPAEKQPEMIARTDTSAPETVFAAPSNRVAKVLQRAKSTKRPVVKKDRAPVKQDVSPELPGQEQDPSEETLARIDAPDAVTVPDVTPTDSQQTLVVVVQLPEEKASQGKGQRVAGKLWENLKKVKHGEFRELGLAPDEVMARFRDKKESEKE